MRLQHASTDSSESAAQTKAAYTSYSLMIGIACGITGAAIEAVSYHGLDNLTVQLGASGVAWLFLY
jgi:dolichol kinase